MKKPCPSQEDIDRRTGDSLLIGLCAAYCAGFCFFFIFDIGAANKEKT
jgi:hypothetical protein